MRYPGNLQFDDVSFDFAEANFYGLYEPGGYMSWHIEMFPSGQDNFIRFSALRLDGIFSPAQLSEKTYQVTDDMAALFEYTVRANGQDRFIQSLWMSFGKWDTLTQSIALSGQGIIEADEDLPEVSYKFKSLLKFKGISIFETSPGATQKFIETYLQNIKDSIHIQFENDPSGLQALISGQF